MSDLERVQSLGYLTMLTTPGPTTYFEDGRGENGFEYIVAKEYRQKPQCRAKGTAKK